MDLTFTSTKTRACINISIVDDQLVEENESFFVSLRFSEAPGREQVLLGKPNTTTVTIMDDDGTYDERMHENRITVNTHRTIVTDL